MNNSINPLSNKTKHEISKLFKLCERHHDFRNRIFLVGRRQSSASSKGNRLSVCVTTSRKCESRISKRDLMPCKAYSISSSEGCVNAASANAIYSLFDWQDADTVEDVLNFRCFAYKLYCAFCDIGMNVSFRVTIHCEIRPIQSKVLPRIERTMQVLYVHRWPSSFNTW